MAGYRWERDWASRAKNPITVGTCSLRRGIKRRTAVSLELAEWLTKTGPLASPTWGRTGVGMTGPKISRDFAIGVAVCAVYIVAAKLSLRLASIHPSATPVWASYGHSHCDASGPRLALLAIHPRWSVRGERHHGGHGAHLTWNRHRQYTGRRSLPPIW